MTKTAQNETTRLKSPVPCDLTVAMIDKTSKWFQLVSSS